MVEGEGVWSPASLAGEGAEDTTPGHRAKRGLEASLHC